MSFIEQLKQQWQNAESGPQIDLTALSEFSEQEQFEGFHEILSNTEYEYMRKEIILQIRKKVSKESNPPLMALQNSEVLPVLLQIINNSSDLSSETILDILWIFTNLASGTTSNVEYLIENGGIQLLLLYLENANPTFVEQAAWGIGNILGEDGHLKETVMNQYNCIQKFCDIVDNWTNDTLLKTKEIFVWIFGNIARGKKKPPVSDQMKLVDYFLQFLAIGQMHDEQQILSETLWGLSYLSDSDEETINKMHQSGVIQNIKQYIEPHHTKSLKVPALRALGNFATGQDIFVDTLISEQVVPTVIDIVSKKETTNNLKKEGCWFLSNIAAGNLEQVTYLANQDQLYNMINGIFSQNMDISVGTECLFIIANMFESELNVELKKKQVAEQYLDKLIQLNQEQGVSFNQKFYKLLGEYAMKYCEVANEGKVLQIDDLEKYAQFFEDAQEDKGYDFFNVLDKFEEIQGGLEEQNDVEEGNINQNYADADAAAAAGVSGAGGFEFGVDAAGGSGGFNFDVQEEQEQEQEEGNQQENDDDNDNNNEAVQAAPE